MCKKELKKMGALLFSPPNFTMVNKYHLCKKCFILVMDFINEFESIPVEELLSTKEERGNNFFIILGRIFCWVSVCCMGLFLIGLLIYLYIN